MQLNKLLTTRNEITLQYGIIIKIMKEKTPQFLALIIQIFLFYILVRSLGDIFSPLSTYAGKFQSHLLGPKNLLGHCNRYNLSDIFANLRSRVAFSVCLSFYIKP